MQKDKFAFSSKLLENAMPETGFLYFQSIFSSVKLRKNLEFQIGKFSAEKLEFFINPLTPITINICKASIFI